MFFVNFTISLSSAKENHVKILVEIILNSLITFRNFTQPLSKICKNEMKSNVSAKMWSQSYLQKNALGPEPEPAPEFSLPGLYWSCLLFHPILSAVSMSLKSSVSGSLEQTGLTHFFFKVGRVDFKEGVSKMAQLPVKETCSQAWQYEFDPWSYVVEGRNNFC